MMNRLGYRVHRVKPILQEGDYLKGIGKAVAIDFDTRHALSMFRTETVKDIGVVCQDNRPAYPKACILCGQ